MEYRKTSELKELENNPRFIKDADFLSLCESIKKSPDYFEARPIILSDRTGELVIIAGNQRFKAANHLGLKEVPTHLISGLTEEREKEIVIRDNVSNGQWDYDILANEWEVSDLQDWGINVPIPTIEDIERDDTVLKSFEDEFNDIKNENAKTPVVKEFAEDYNAFIIICTNEIDEVYLRNLLNIDEVRPNEHGLSDRKTNIITVEELKCAITSR